MSDTHQIRLSRDTVFFQLADVERLAASGDLAAAATSLNAIQRANPADPRVLLTGIFLAAEAKNPTAERQTAERLLAMAPDWPAALMEMARIESRDGKHQSAVSLAKRAVDAAPGDASVVDRAVRVANAAHDYAAANEFLLRALEISPNSAAVQAAVGYNAMCHLRYADALPWLESALRTQSEDLQLRSLHAFALLHAGRTEDAKAQYESLRVRLPENKVIAYYAAIARGETPSVQPPAIHQPMFDRFASSFEASVTALGYDVPRVAAERIRAAFPALECNVLDLGCGTGLLGHHLTSLRGALVGVDTSRAMIDKAAGRRVYDKFHQVDLADALRDTPSNEFDVIAACDVFIYVGSLQGVVESAARVLKPNGLLVFSCEAAGDDGPDFVLGSAGRYAHRMSGVEAQCSRVGLTQIALEAMVIRKEAGADVNGFLVTARKPGE